VKIAEFSEIGGEEEVVVLGLWGFEKGGGVFGKYSQVRKGGISQNTIAGEKTGFGTAHCDVQRNS
jgi:hypothetical protein